MVIACIISFIVGAVLMLLVLGIVSMCKERNKVHFYIAKNYNGELNVFLNKPLRNENRKIWMQYSFEHNKRGWKWVSTRIAEDEYFCELGLNVEDYEYLKWEDEPVEVFLNLED